MHVGTTFAGVAFSSITALWCRDERKSECIRPFCRVAVFQIFHDLKKHEGDTLSALQSKEYFLRTILCSGEGYEASICAPVPTSYTTFDDLSDVDECRTGNHRCSEKAECKNEIGGYTCSCKKGYTGSCEECRGKSRDNGFLISIGSYWRTITVR